MTTDVEHAIEDEDHRSLGEVAEDLRQAVAAARRAHSHLREEEHEAWARYTAELAAVVDKMEEDLAEQRSALAVARDAQRQELREAAAKVAERAQMALGELRVQEALAEMEARDRVGPRWGEVVLSVDALRKRLQEAVARILAERPRDTEGHTP